MQEKVTRRSEVVGMLATEDCDADDGDVILDRFVQLNEAPGPRQDVQGLEEEDALRVLDVLRKLTEILKVVLK